MYMNFSNGISLLLGAIALSSCSDTENIDATTKVDDTAQIQELTASELARAQGINWWTIKPPESKEESLWLSFEIGFADGKILKTGKMKFPTDANIKVFCRSDPNEGLHVSACSEGAGSGVLSTVFSENPFKEAKVVSSQSNNKVYKSGEYLYKGSTTDTVTSDQSLKTGEFGLRAIMEP